METTANPELLLVGLVIFNDAHYQNERKWIKPVVKGRAQLWNRLAERHLELAPKRTDVLVAYPFNAFRSLLGIAGDTSAPTYAELYSGEWRHPTCSGHGR